MQIYPHVSASNAVPLAFPPPTSAAMATSGTAARPASENDGEAPQPQHRIVVAFYGHGADGFVGAMMEELALRGDQIAGMVDPQFEVACALFVGGLDVALHGLQLGIASEFGAGAGSRVFVVVVPTDRSGRAILPQDHYAYSVPGAQERILGAVARTHALRSADRGRGGGSGGGGERDARSPHIDVGSALLVHDVASHTADCGDLTDPDGGVGSVLGRTHAIACPVSHGPDGEDRSRGRHAAYHAMYATVSCLLSALSALRHIPGGHGDAQNVCLVCPLLGGADRANDDTNGGGHGGGRYDHDDAIRSAAHQMVDALLVAFAYGRDYDVGTDGTDGGRTQALVRLRVSGVPLG